MFKVLKKFLEMFTFNFFHVFYVLQGDTPGAPTGTVKQAVMANKVLGIEDEVADEIRGAALLAEAAAQRVSIYDKNKGALGAYGYLTNQQGNAGVMAASQGFLVRGIRFTVISGEDAAEAIFDLRDFVAIMKKAECSLQINGKEMFGSWLYSHIQPVYITPNTTATVTDQSSMKVINGCAFISLANKPIAIGPGDNYSMFVDVVTPTYLNTTYSNVYMVCQLFGWRGRPVK